jgi:hypothetical protein
MRLIVCLYVLFFLSTRLQAQYVYTIKADSVKLTSCDSSELIIENHTQNVPGFLYNTGNGRTIFKHGLQQLTNGSYLIGADTLHAWIQGGNSFGTTGILGTNDNTNLDFYTNNTGRARLTNAGNFLLGTTTDNGNLLQVNGNASYTGNVGIGSATITNGGLLYGTDAILFNHVVSSVPGFQQNDIYVSKLDNVLYNYQYRFNTTSTVGSDGSLSLDIVIPPYELSGLGIVYPGGKMCFSFWEFGIPQSISVTMHDSASQSWFGPYTSTTNLSPQTFGYFEVGIPAAFNYVNEIKITMTPPSGGGINLQNLEYVLSTEQGLVNPFPYVGKSGTEHLYNFMYFGNGGNNIVGLSPLASYPSFFLDNVGIGTSAPSAQLHTTGSVRFAGLTQDNTQTQVLVSDTSGNLYYRSASSLAADNLIRSSLAVNGTIKSKKIIISPDEWADYVFDSTYRLPRLAEVETYIRREHHLPGVPSAATVRKDSLDVGAGQSALLKKIEELTLYSIGQDKKIQLLEDEVETLKKMILEDRKNSNKNITN